MTIGPTGGTRPCCAFNTNGIKTIKFDEDSIQELDKLDEFRDILNIILEKNHICLEKTEHLLQS